MVDIHSEEYILGQNIRKYRLKKGWAQKQLSDAVDIDRADISKYENGTKEIGVEFAKLTKDGQITIRNMMKFLQSQQMAE